MSMPKPFNALTVIPSQEQANCWHAGPEALARSSELGSVAKPASVGPLVRAADTSAMSALPPFPLDEPCL